MQEKLFGESGKERAENLRRPKAGATGAVLKRIISIIGNQPETNSSLKEYLDNSSWCRLGEWCRGDLSSVRRIATSLVDVVLVDMRLPADRAIQSVYLLKKLRSNLTVVVLGERLQMAGFIRYLHAGADGFLTLPSTRLGFEETLRNALDGWKPFPQEIGKKLADHVARRFLGNRDTLLTRAEAEVLTGLIDGKRDKDIAGDRGISERTVQTITRGLYKKLGAHSRTQVVQHFLPVGEAFAMARRLDPSRRGRPKE